LPARVAIESALRRRKFMESCACGYAGPGRDVGNPATYTGVGRGSVT
jgi:hypothetical protein